MSLKNKIIRLAYEKPELREHLLPLVTAADTFKCPTCGTKVLEQTSYCVKCKKKVKKAASGKLEYNIEGERFTFWLGIDSKVEVNGQLANDRDLAKAKKWIQEQLKKSKTWEGPGARSDINALKSALKVIG